MKKMDRNIWVYGISAIVLFSVLAMAMPVSAQPSADSFGVDDAYGAPGTHVIVPVNITNTSSGPIRSIVFNITYDKNVINVTDVLRGDLTANWSLGFNNSLAWGTHVSLYGDPPIPNGSSNSVALLNFSVIGGAPYETGMNLNDIQLSKTGFDLGTAPAKNGTFFVTEFPPVPAQVPEYNLFGLAALIGLLSVALAISVRRRRS